MRITVPVFAFLVLVLPSAALAQGLFAFEGAAPAQGGFNRTPMTPVQSTLQEVPSLEGPYGNTLPSLQELGDMDADAKTRPPAGSAEGPAPATAEQTAGEPPVTSLRPRMNPLRAPVRETRKVGRFLRRFVVNPLRQRPQASKQNNHTNSQPGNPVP